VFAIRPGSVTKFSVPEMVDHLNQGIRWVKRHAGEYALDPERLGMMGASAGGHLACLAAVTAEGGEAGNAKDDPDTEEIAAGGNGDASETSTDEPNTSVMAVAVFFPPTDFVDFGGVKIDPRAADGFGPVIRRLAFPDGVADATDDAVAAGLVAISPARRVTANAPPFLLIHGDADPVVPLQQSEAMVAALRKAGVPAELIVKKGGGHPWLTIPVEVKVLADWFDKQLAAE
jgi:acetyl esterase/lipase